MLINSIKLLQNRVQRLILSRKIRLPLVLFLLFAGVIFQQFAKNLPFSTPTSIAGVAGVADVRDGDSLVIEGKRVRLEGIDAPERDQSCMRDAKAWACGRAAQKHLARLIGNHAVKCSITKRDRFERLLGRCTAASRDINRTMVRDGMAVSFGGNYRSEEAQARRERSGLWSSRFERPQAWRRKNQSR
jgi:endonuclease YncB( thermonuclease family)